MLYPLSKRVKTMRVPSGEKAGFWSLAPAGGVVRRMAPSGRVSRDWMPGSAFMPDSAVSKALGFQEPDRDRCQL
ncbi:MAG: hypothetical protein ACE5LU_18410 [Anaerolineae bacterium]